jgi:hypothetical protein
MPSSGAKRDSGWKQVYKFIRTVGVCQFLNKTVQWMYASPQAVIVILEGHRSSEHSPNIHLVKAYEQF